MTVDKDTKHQERLDLTQIKIQFLGGVSMPHIAFNYATTKKKKKKKKKTCIFKLQEAKVSA